VDDHNCGARVGIRSDQKAVLLKIEQGKG
jgi:hypothetical protein